MPKTIARLLPEAIAALESHGCHISLVADLKSAQPGALPAHPFDGQFEPPAEAVAKDNPAIPLHEIAAASTAISLKRIADAMTGPTNEWGETMAEAVGGNIRRACMDISSIVHNAMNGRR